MLQRQQHTETRVYDSSGLNSGAFLDSEPFLTPLQRADYAPAEAHKVRVYDSSAPLTRAFLDSETFLTAFPRADYAPAGAEKPGTQVYDFSDLKREPFLTPGLSCPFFPPRAGYAPAEQTQGNASLDYSALKMRAFMDS